METKKNLVGNELMRQLIAIKVDTMWRMLALKKEGRLPKVDDEGATGRYDNKGALFVPGCFIHGDSDKKRIEVEPFKENTAEVFRNRVRAAMKVDNATLMYQNGMASGVNLDNGFFAEMAGNIISLKQAAMKRQGHLSATPPDRLTSNHITRSYTPTFVNPPYGSRTKLSSCIGACFIEPSIYFVRSRTLIGLQGDTARDFWNAIAASRRPIVGDNGAVLAGPYIVACHTSRYRKEALCGIIRILGFGRFGEFACFTLEEATTDLRHELDSSKSEFHPNDLFADYDGTQVVGVLRFFPKTTPGKRLKRTTAMLVSPGKDLDLDLAAIGEEARERYKVPSD